MTWIEMALFGRLLSLANRYNGRLGLCEGLTGNRLAKDIRKSRQATHRALSGLSSTEGPSGKRGRYIEVTPEGILVLNFEAKKGPDASALGRIPTGCITAGGGDCAASQPAGKQPDPAVLQPAISIKRRRRSKDNTGARKARKKPARKSAPPHPLSGLVRWDKEKRQVRFEEGGEVRLLAELAITEGEENLSRLTRKEMQLGWGKLNNHLVGAPFKTNKNTLPAFVLGWFQTDLRTKDGRPSVGDRPKTVVQRINEKTERFFIDGLKESSRSDVDIYFKRISERGAGGND